MSPPLFNTELHPWKHELSPKISLAQQELQEIVQSCLLRGLKKISDRCCKMDCNMRGIKKKEEKETRKARLEVYFFSPNLPLWISLFSPYLHKRQPEASLRYCFQSNICINKRGNYAGPAQHHLQPVMTEPQ